MLICITVLLILAGGAFFILYSPWPAVWLLRGGMDGPIEKPEGYEEQTGGIRVRKDLAYPSQYGKNRFDLYLPQTDEKAPLLVWVHGGAFVAGDKSGTQIWASLLASEGYAVASMNYEWAPEASWPAQVKQTAECLKALERLSEKEPALDMGRVFLAGDSAGAHIAMQAAQAWFNGAFAKQTGITGLKGLDRYSLRGVLLYCGPYKPQAFLGIRDKKLRFFLNKAGHSYVGSRRWPVHENARFLDIIPWLTKDCPPVYITDGNSGSFERQGRLLGEALRALSVPVTERYFAAECGAVNHEYQMQLTKPEAIKCYLDTLDFLDRNSGQGQRNVRKERGTGGYGK